MLEQIDLQVAAGGRRSRPKSPLRVLNESSSGTTYHEHQVQTVLNPPESTGMGFWSLNPYVGCEYGCSYCYARYSHRYAVERACDGPLLASAMMEPSPYLAFERRILVKRKEDLRAALRRDLVRVGRRVAREGPQTIGIGTSTDPYQPAERNHRLTRACLELLAGANNVEVGIVTKSPLVTRDADLLSTMNSVVRISLISADRNTVSLLEARSPTPEARFRALRRLKAAGVRAGIIMAPIVPGLTDSRRQIESLLKRAAEAGADFVNPVPLRLYGSLRKTFTNLLASTQPRVAEDYDRLYSKGRMVERDYAQGIIARVKAIAAEFGIPVESDLPPRDKPQAQLEMGI